MGILLLVIVMTFILGFALIFLIQKKSPQHIPQMENPLTPSLQNLSFEDFFELTRQLLEKWNLQIGESFRENETEADIYAINPSPFVGSPVIVHLSLYPEGNLISSMDVMNFASNLVGERRGKGLFITTGVFAPEVWTLPELPPMEFIDGKKLGELLEEHGLLPNPHQLPTN